MTKTLEQALKWILLTGTKMQVLPRLLRGMSYLQQSSMNVSKSYWCSGFNYQIRLTMIYVSVPISERKKCCEHFNTCMIPCSLMEPKNLDMTESDWYQTSKTYLLQPSSCGLNHLCKRIQKKSTVNTLKHVSFLAH